jgi:hypothetical protein
MPNGITNLPSEVLSYRNAMAKPTYTSKGHTINCGTGAQTIEPFYLPQISGMNCVAFGLHYTVSIDKSGTTAATVNGCSLQYLVEDLFVRNSLNEKIQTYRDGRAFTEAMILWNHKYINDGIIFHLDTNTTATFSVDVFVPVMIPAGNDPWLVDIEQGDLTDIFATASSTASVNSIYMIPTYHYSQENVLEFGADTLSLTLNGGALTSVNPYLNTAPSFLHVWSGFDDEVADDYWPLMEGAGVIDDWDIMDGQGRGMRLDGHEAYLKFAENCLELGQTVIPATYLAKTLKYNGLNQYVIALWWDDPIYQGRTIRYDIELTSTTNQSVVCQMFFSRASASREDDQNAPEVRISPVPEPSVLRTAPVTYQQASSNNMAGYTAKATRTVNARNARKFGAGKRKVSLF